MSSPVVTFNNDRQAEQAKWANLARWSAASPGAHHMVASGRLQVHNMHFPWPFESRLMQVAVYEAEQGRLPRAETLFMLSACSCGGEIEPNMQPARREPANLVRRLCTALRRIAEDRPGDIDTIRMTSARKLCEPMRRIWLEGEEQQQQQQLHQQQHYQQAAVLDMPFVLLAGQPPPPFQAPAAAAVAPAPADMGFWEVLRDEPDLDGLWEELIVEPPAVPAPGSDGTELAAGVDAAIAEFIDPLAAPAPEPEPEHEPEPEPEAGGEAAPEGSPELQPLSDEELVELFGSID